MRNIFTFPARNLRFVIPVVILAALVLGLIIDTSVLKQFILPVAMATVFPAMIGFRAGELLCLRDLRLLSVNLVCNFVILPILALLIGWLLLSRWPELRIGLLLLSVIPGGNMVVAFTMLFDGNVPASLKLSVTNLLLGTLLAPVYLYLLAGRFVAIDIFHIGKTMGLVVIVPLCMGIITYKLLLKRYTPEQFKKEIKPLLPSASAWGLIYLVFTSISMKAPTFFNYPALVGQSLLSLFLWYAGIFAVCVGLGRLLFKRRDGITLLLNVSLRNLPIAIGIAVTAFGSQTAVIVALAFLFQQQLVLWFDELDKKYHWLGEDDQAGR
ncbi:MAG: arsenic resistance protein [Desulfobulbus sp.]|nr:MAG: arsenic resistance protein [Desulfobulbus sp.]